MAELYLFDLDTDEFVMQIWVKEADEESAQARYEAKGFRAILASDLIRQGIPSPRFRGRDYVPRPRRVTNVRFP